MEQIQSRGSAPRKRWVERVEGLPSIETTVLSPLLGSVYKAPSGQDARCQGAGPRSPKFEVPPTRSRLATRRARPETDVRETAKTRGLSIL